MHSTLESFIFLPAVLLPSLLFLSPIGGRHSRAELLFASKAVGDPLAPHRQEAVSYLYGGRKDKVHGSKFIICKYLWKNEKLLNKLMITIVSM